MQKVLSISVAAYNVEKFIEQCLDSFIDPAILDRVEVLVTDDGSKDRTPEIVSAYEKKYPGTFRLISQKNAGPGSTVNSGIKHATGKYFRMVDGDDWVNTAQMGAFLDILENGFKEFFEIYWKRQMPIWSVRIIAVWTMKQGKKKKRKRTLLRVWTCRFLLFAINSPWRCTM